MIGGNIEAVIEQKISSTINAIGERVHQWAEVYRLTGFLDFSSGENKYTYDAKLQETTHLFICDYADIDRTAENKRMIVDGFIYDILYIDNPMELDRHLEINLKYVGAV